MMLSETNRLLLDGLKAFGISKTAGAAIYVMLQSEDEIWEMMNYMADNPEGTEEQFLRKAESIAGI